MSDSCSLWFFWSGLSLDASSDLITIPSTCLRALHWLLFVALFFFQKYSLLLSSSGSPTFSLTWHLPSTNPLSISCRLYQFFESPDVIKSLINHLFDRTLSILTMISGLSWSHVSVLRFSYCLHILTLNWQLLLRSVFRFCLWAFLEIWFICEGSTNFLNPNIW